VTADAVRALFAPLLAHKFNQEDALSRAARAQALGLPPEVVATLGTPYPGATVNTTTNTSSQQAGGVLRTALAGALLFAGGAGVALGLAKYLSPAPAAVQPLAPRQQPAPAAPAWDAVYEQQIEPPSPQHPDGTWKQLRREHLAPPGP
jgi:hypothetical protein